MVLRERVVAARKEGRSAAEIAKWFQISIRSVQRYWAQYQQDGHVAPKPRGGYRRSRLEAHDDVLLEWIESQPDLTLAEIQERCQTQLQLFISITPLRHRIMRLGLHYKKNACCRRTNP